MIVFPETPILDYFAWKLGITPVIPKFYWDAYSQEEIIKELCKELDSITKYSEYLGTEMNVDRTTINQIAETLNALQAGGWFDTYSELIQQWIRDIDNIKGIVADVLNESEIPDRVTALEGAVGDNSDDITALQTALGNEVTDRGNADTALGGRIDATNDRIDTSNERMDSDFVHKLETTADFITLQPAVGELYRTQGFSTINDGGSALYRIESGTTSDGMTVFATATTGVIAVMVVEGTVKPAQLGAVGTSDASAAFNYLLSSNTNGLPVDFTGSYSIETGITAVATRIAETSLAGCKITAVESMESMFNVIEPYYHQVTVQGLTLDGNRLANIGLAINSRSVNLSDITVRYCLAEQIHAYGNISGHVHYGNLNLFGTAEAACKGLILEVNDLVVSDSTIFYCNVGIEFKDARYVTTSKIHFWPGSGYDHSQRNSIGIDVQVTGVNLFNDLYFDGLNTGINFANGVAGFAKMRGGYALWPDIESSSTPYQYDNACIVRIGTSATVNVGISGFYNGSRSPDFVYMRTGTELNNTTLDNLVANDNLRLLNGSAYGQINVAASRMYYNNIARIVENAVTLVNGNYYPIGYVIAPGTMPASANNSVNMRFTPTSNRASTFGWADFYVHILRSSNNTYTVNVDKEVRETYTGYEFCIGKIERVKCGTAATDYEYWAYPVYIHALASISIGDLWISYEAAGQKFNWFPAGNAVAVSDSDIIATLNMATA